MRPIFTAGVEAPTARFAARTSLLLVLLMSGNTARAMGNHPEANICSAEKPYYAVCTAGSHDLQGWVGKCHAARSDAQSDADEHARKAHGGVTQWTGVARTGGAASYGDNRGLPP